MSSRRDFLRQLSGATLLLRAAPAIASLVELPAAQESVSIPGEGGMIVRSARFLDLETPVEYLKTWLTPVPHFFVRNHMHEPELSAAKSKK